MTETLAFLAGMGTGLSIAALLYVLLWWPGGGLRSLRRRSEPKPNSLWDQEFWGQEFHDWHESRCLVCKPQPTSLPSSSEATETEREPQIWNHSSWNE